MTGTYDALDAIRIGDALKAFSKENLTSPYSSKVSCFKSIDSTNAWLLANGSDGDVCLSETQTSGRGRRNNPWISPDSGNIYLSFCCYIDNSVQHRSLLGLVAGIATAEALQEIGLTGHGLKWPNDIFWKDKKLGGILVQTAENYQKFIIGIGLNVSLPDASRNEITQDAVSLEEALQDTAIDRETVVVILLQRLLLHSEMFAKLPFQAFSHSWQRWDILHGREVSFQHQDQEVTGNVKGIDQQGRIGIYLDSTSNIEYFSAADIKLKKPSFI